MKRILAAVLAMLLLCAGAMAEEIAFETYAQSFAELTEEVWAADGIELIQTLAPADGVTVSVCLEGENVAAITVEFPCGEIGDAVRAAVGNLGLLSESALEQVFAMEEGATLEVEDCMVYRVHGKNRDAFGLCAAEDAEEMVWQPIHGGEKLHSEYGCSGMDVARMITAEAAQLTGWENCKRCHEAE